MNYELKKNIPELRFSEFSEDWAVKKLGEIAEIKSGGTPKRGKVEYWNGNIPWVTTSLLNNDEIWTTDEFITKDGLNNSSAKLFPINTILMAMYGQGKTRGMVSKLKIEASTNQACAALILNNLVDNEFVFQSLKNEYETLRKLSNDGGQKNLSSGLIRNFKFVIPNSLTEQTKIATFLTAVDKRIKLLQKKKAELEQYKKGVMQKLFSVKTDCNPSLRFKNDNGSDFEDWEEKKLGEVCEITTGKLDANAMVENGEYRFYTCAKNFYRIDDFAFNFEALLISGNGANVGYVHHYNGKFNAYQRTYVLFNLKASYEFVKFFLDKNLKRRIHREKKDGNTPYIIMETLSGMKINLPSFKEQQKIANFLSSIDKSIDNMNNQIDDTVLFKKGLLQKMFV